MELKNAISIHSALAGALYLGLVDVPGTHIIVFFSIRFFEVLP